MQTIDVQGLMITLYIVPVAIICSAVIGFFAAWYNSLLARQAQEISLQVNHFCETLDKLKETAIKYWLNDDYDEKKYDEVLVVSSLHGILFQQVYLTDSLSAFAAPWWKFSFNLDGKNISELGKIHIQLHNLITGGDFGGNRSSDPERCRRISAKIERFKFCVRTYRRRY